MKADRVVLIILTLCVATGGSAQQVARAAQPPGPEVVHMQTTFGTIAGIVRSPANLPIASATVTAARLDGSSIRTTISNSEGIYSFSDLPPGEYAVTVQSDGYSDTVISSLQVTSGRATRTDIAVAMAAVAPVAAASASAAVAPRSPVAGSPTPVTNGSNAEAGPAAATSAEPTHNTASGFWARMEKGLAVKKRDSNGQASSTAEPVLLATTSPSIPVPLRNEQESSQTVGGQKSSQTKPASQPPASPDTGRLPKALQQPEPPPAVDNQTPFAFGDFTWVNGSPRTKDTVLDTEFFTPEVRFDSHYMEDFNQPKDHTIVGATESFRSGEVQVEQASVGGDFHWQGVRGRILFMEGLFATTTPRNDASAAVGQWDLRNAYRYVSEAYGGYHFNVNHGLNVDAGIFVSYIGLFSYYNFDNWTYQPSYVSSNTPWFFNGVRVQWFPTNKLKIEPWFINGWQSYAKFNGHPGLGGQMQWEPKEWLKVVANQYGFGQDNLGLPKTQRIHTDDSIVARYYNNPEASGLSKMAFSLTADAGCQYGGGLQCTGAPSKNKSTFIGWMLYDRMWFHKDLLALTLGGGEMSNWGRYLTLLPPVDGADAISGTPYFTENPGQRAHMWDSTVNLQYMPKQYITWWMEAGYRHSDVPYFAGRGGVTPPGGDNGEPQYFTCSSGATSGTANLSAAQAACGGASSVWFPDLRRSEMKFSLGLMVKF